MPAVAILLVAIAVMNLPGRYHLLPSWAAVALIAFIVLPMIVRIALPRSAPWVRVERVTTLVGSVLVTGTVVATLTVLISSIVFRSRQFDALGLLASSTSLWLTNVIAFALIYWAVDDGGPDAREQRLPSYPDLLFTQAGAGDAVPPNWLPSFIDYLFVSFTTQTAFGPTDTLPLTSRAKAMMMTQSLISLVTLVVVASRAIGILQ